MSRETGCALGWLLVGLGVAAALALGAVWTLVSGMAEEPGLIDGPPQPIPLAADKSLGINTDLSRLEAGVSEDALASIEATGFRWLRQPFPWDLIEPEQGAYDWAVWDRVVEAAFRHNLRLIAVLDRSPEWARRAEDSGNAFAPPAQARDFGAFAAAFAARYGDRIDHYQVWDEPNIAPHWGTREIDPEAYAHLLREGAIQIRTADPDAVILAGALAPNVEPGGANMSELLFLEALYQVGAAEWFDLVAAQLYDFGEPAGAAPEAGRLNWKRAALLRQVMQDNHDTETAIWSVSFGLSQEHAGAVAEVVTTAREEWPWLGPMLWAAWSPDDMHGRYALTSEDAPGEAVREALSALATAPAVAWPGSYPADHPSGQYQGGWRLTPCGADIGTSGDRLRIPFRGERLDLIVRRGDYRAFLFATVDGRPANALPQDSEGRAYVVLYDPARESDTVTLASGLPFDDHVAEIVAERGWGQWAILGWIVAGKTGAGVPWLAVVLALSAAVVLGVVAHISWPRRRLVLAGLRPLVNGYRALDDRLALVITAGAALLLYVTAGTVASLVALGLLGLLLLLRPEMGLPLIAVALPFYQLGKPLLGKAFSMVELLTLLTAVGWAVNWGLFRVTNHAGRIPFQVSRFTPLDWGVIALVVVGAVSLLWAEYLRVAAREFRTVLLESALYYGLLRALVRERRGLWHIADAWVLGGALISVVGLAQWVFDQNLIAAGDVWRVRGFYGSPNNLALYLGRVLPLGVALVAWGQRGRRKWAYGLAAGMMVAAILLSYSRGAWLLGVPAALLFMAALRGRRAFAVTVGLLAVATVGVLLVVGSGRLTALLDTAEGTTFFRLQLWQSSWAMVRDHPLLGVGLDNFLYQYRSYYVLPTAWEEFNLSHPHNLVLDFWLRLGLPGLAVGLWLLVAFFRRGWQAYHHLPSGAERLMVLGLMGGMVAAIAHGLVDNAFFLVDLAFAFMLMVALVQCPRWNTA